MAVAASICWRGTEFEPRADDLGGIGDRQQADGDHGDREQRCIRREGLDEEQDQIEDDQERDAPEELDIGDRNRRTGAQNSPGVWRSSTMPKPSTNPRTQPISVISSVVPMACSKNRIV